MNYLNHQVLVLTTDHRIICGKFVALDYLGDIVLSTAIEAVAPQEVRTNPDLLSSVSVDDLLSKEVHCVAIPQQFRVKVIALTNEDILS
ncbi:hypothetical protein GEMRC1_011466 [Eukaryota sp. GEM-RC1]